MNKKIIFIGILIFNMLSALPLKDFPLWNSVWIVGEGENKWIYPSVARFRPEKVALIKFNEYSKDSQAIAAEIQYANLQTCDPMYSTAAAIDEMMKQFTADKYEILTNKYKKDYIDTNEFIKNCSSKYPDKFSEMQENAKKGKILVPFGEINDDYSPLHIEYYPYDDTLWTFHYYAKDLVGYNRIVIQYGSRETENLSFSDSIVIDSVGNRTVVGQFAVDSVFDNVSKKWEKVKVSIWTQSKPKLTTYKNVGTTGNDSIFAQYDTGAALMIMKYDNNSDDNIYAEVYMPKGNIDATNAQDAEKLLVRKVSVNDSGEIIPGSKKEFELIEQHSLKTAIAYYESRKEEKKVFKTDNIGFWRLHITPEVWFFCRDHDGEVIPATNDVKYFWHTADDGDISQFHDSLRLQFKSAVNAREKSAREIDKGINNAEDLVNANKWLSPVISEISSTIISVSFLGGNDYSNSKKIILDSQDKELAGGKNLFFTHTPQRMYKVKDTPQNMDIEIAAIKLSARDSLEEAEAEGLYNCEVYWAGWKNIDKKTTGYIFPEEVDSLGNSILPRKRNFDIDDAIFMYAGCPCDYDTITGMTPMQLRSYVYKPIPTHTLSLAEKALDVFRKFWNILIAKEDKEILNSKIKGAEAIVSKLNEAYLKIYDNKRENFPINCDNCSKSWLDDEPIIRLLRGY